MEPSQAVCRMREDGVLEVWASTETRIYSQMGAAEAVGIDQDQAEVEVRFAGGTFGLHSTSSHDPTAEAAQVARGLDWKYPVRVQSLREEDFKTGHYRPMAAHRVRAGADAAGQLTAIHHEVVVEPVSVVLEPFSPNLPIASDFLFKGGVDYMTVAGIVDGPYALPNVRFGSTNFASGGADYGLALDRQFPHPIRARVRDRRARHRRGTRPRRPAQRSAPRDPPQH